MKAYVKPELFYERYELSKHIAACAWDLNQADKETCSALSDTEWGGDGVTTLFTATATCNLDENNYESFCYTNGSSGMNVFNS